MRVVVRWWHIRGPWFVLGFFFGQWNHDVTLCSMGGCAVEGQDPMGSCETWGLRVWILALSVTSNCMSAEKYMGWGCQCCGLEIVTNSTSTESWLDVLLVLCTLCICISCIKCTSHSWTNCTEHTLRPTLQYSVPPSPPHNHFAHLERGIHLSHQHRLFCPGLSLLKF